jgi:hypothetical protein
MRKRLLAVVAAGALFALALGLSPASASSGVRAATHRVGHGSASDLTILVNRVGNPGVYSILSQDFTDAGFDIYDSYLADDFAVPGTLTLGWKVQGMRSIGIFFNGAGPCDSESVAFYKDASGLPGAQTGTTQTGAGTLTGSGTYTLVFGTAQKLAKGATYWASMWCTMAYAAGGEWGWSDRVDQAGSSAKWENPGGGFGTCPTWADMDTCVGITGEPDLQFALAGGAV